MATQKLPQKSFYFGKTYIMFMLKKIVYIMMNYIAWYEGKTFRRGTS